MVTVCIPARLKSTRFPNKLLADLGGKPVLQHVFERACFAIDPENIVVLCDSKIIAETAVAFGANVLNTREDCISGTDRIASVLDKIDGDFIINIQGDEPLFDTEIITRMLAKLEESDGDIFTPIFKFNNMSDVLDSNCVKAVINHAGRALYFSRSVIPFIRDEKNTNNWINYTTFYGHIGIYGYRRHVLKNYKSMKNSKLESVEKLEQLRFLENGYTIDTIEVAHCSVGIDTPEDLERARKKLGY